MSLFTKNTTRSNWNSMSSKLSLNFIFFEKCKPQMNTDGPRFVTLTYRNDSDSISTELVRTKTYSGYSNFGG